MLRIFSRIVITLTMLPLAGAAVAFDPLSGDFSKPDYSQPLFRMLTWNVHNNFIITTDDDGRYARVIKAINPDIIAFQEMDHSLTAGQISTRLESYFPDSTWYVHRGKADGSNTGVSNRNVIASRFPLSMTRQDTNPTSNIRGVCIAMADLPGSTDLYIMNIHFKAGGTVEDHERRQIHADAIINWMRDARSPGGDVNIADNTPMVVTGDFNLGEAGDRAPYHARKTMLDGTIFDNVKYGASSAPDWDGTETTDASPYDYFTGMPWTHGSSDPKGRIDRFYCTDSVIHKVSGFVLNSRTMSAAARSAAGGILVNDTSGASDHLPVVTDFALGPNPNPPGQLVINEFNANDHGANEYTFVELKNIGGREINLKGPVDYWLKASDQLPTTIPGTENEQYAFDLHGVVPPGGLFVVYDGSGFSSGIKAEIESRLPALNRQDLPAFTLDNDNNSAMALVQQVMSRLNVTHETLVEALGWSDDPSTTKYFRLDSGNNLLVTMVPAQWTEFFGGATPSDLSMSRNPGYQVLNNFAGWTPATPLTPGAENSIPANVSDWMVY